MPIPTPTTEELQKVKSAAGLRTASFRKKKDTPEKPKFVVPDNLAALPEEMIIKLDAGLLNARKNGNRLDSGYREITKEITTLFEACVIRMGGDKQALANASLSDGLLIVYRTAEAVDEKFGEGAFKETRSSVNKGCSTWRRPWGRVRTAALGIQKVLKTPLEIFEADCRKAANSTEVAYVKALSALNRAFGKG
jgi:hypothetical protein